MSKQDKVLGFFAIGKEDFDPSLFCVAIFAIGMNMVFYNFFLIQFAQTNPPKLSKENDWPKFTKDITFELIFGSILFGLGWGIIGYCPGPMLVNLFVSSTARISIIGILLGHLLKSTFYK
jgi:uncharacterized protein